MYIYKKIIQRFLRSITISLKGFQSFLPERIHRVKKGIKPKICIIGGFGYCNIGDEAMLRADILWFYSHIPNLRITLFSVNPKSTNEYHDEYSIKDLNEIHALASTNLNRKLKGIYYSINFLYSSICAKFGIRIKMWENGRLFLDELLSADVLFNIGGGNINSLMRDSLYKKVVTYLAAKISGIPIIISGQTIGPLVGKADKLVAAFGLNLAVLITFRDKNISCARVKEIYVTKPILCDTADDAMKLPSMSYDKKKETYNLEIGNKWNGEKSNLIVAFNLKASLKKLKDINCIDGDLLSEVSLMAKIGKYLISNYGAKIIFIPTDNASNLGDRFYHQKIAERIGDTSRIHLVNTHYSDIEYKALLSNCDIAIGSRYHFCIFAASELVPFLGLATGIYQKTKLKGLSDLCGIPGSYFPEDMEIATLDSVKPYIDYLVLHRKEFKNKLEGIIPMLVTKSTIATEYTLRYLDPK